MDASEGEFPKISGVQFKRGGSEGDVLSINYWESGRFGSVLFTAFGAFLGGLFFIFGLFLYNEISAGAGSIAIMILGIVLFLLVVRIALVKTEITIDQHERLFTARRTVCGLTLPKTKVMPFDDIMEFNAWHGFGRSSSPALRINVRSSKYYICINMPFGESDLNTLVSFIEVACKNSTTFSEKVGKKPTASLEKVYRNPIENRIDPLLWKNGQATVKDMALYLIKFGYKDLIPSLQEHFKIEDIKSGLSILEEAGDIKREYEGHFKITEKGIADFAQFVKGQDASDRAKYANGEHILHVLAIGPRLDPITKQRIYPSKEKMHLLDIIFTRIKRELMPNGYDFLREAFPDDKFDELDAGAIADGDLMAPFIIANDEKVYEIMNLLEHEKDGGLSFMDYLDVHIYEIRSPIQYKMNCELKIGLYWNMFDDNEICVYAVSNGQHNNVKLGQFYPWSVLINVFFPDE